MPHGFTVLGDHFQLLQPLLVLSELILEVSALADELRLHRLHQLVVLFVQLAPQLRYYLLQLFDSIVATLEVLLQFPNLLF